MTKISDLGTTFSSNLNEENTVLTFKAEELAGVPQDLVDSFEKVIFDKIEKWLETIFLTYLSRFLSQCRYWLSIMFEQEKK